MLSCKNITDIACDYLEKHLPPYKRLQVKLHLLMCHHCRRYLSQLRTTIGTLKLKPKIISDEKAKQIVDKVIDEKSQ